MDFLKAWVFNNAAVVAGVYAWAIWCWAKDGKARYSRDPGVALLVAGMLAYLATSAWKQSHCSSVLPGSETYLVQSVCTVAHYQVLIAFSVGVLVSAVGPSQPKKKS